LKVTIWFCSYTILFDDFYSFIIWFCSLASHVQEQEVGDGTSFVLFLYQVLQELA
uniref:Uncharacterized protein n=1 Tax=Anas platyrhynchos TaxID=8839 RepID=A0A8B9SIS7_ANAPL